MQDRADPQIAVLPSRGSALATLRQALARSFGLHDGGPTDDRPHTNRQPGTGLHARDDRARVHQSPRRDRGVLPARGGDRARLRQLERRSGRCALPGPRPWLGRPRLRRWRRPLPRRRPHPSRSMPPPRSPHPRRRRLPANRARSARGRSQGPRGRGRSRAASRGPGSGGSTARSGRPPPSGRRCRAACTCPRRR